MRNRIYMHNVRKVIVDIRRDEKRGEDTLSFSVIDVDGNITPIAIFFDGHANITGDLVTVTPYDWT